FNSSGPFQVDEDLKVSVINYTWNQEFALLYIDNQVGVGYSFTDSEKGIVTIKPGLTVNPLSFNVIYFQAMQPTRWMSAEICTKHFFSFSPCSKTTVEIHSFSLANRMAASMCQPLATKSTAWVRR